MRPLNVLISGAGIAGLTLGYWLGRAGSRVTIVERAAGQRSSGSPVDVRGQAADVASRMGILGRLRELTTCVDGMRFVDASGRVAARVATQAGARRDVEIARGDLVGVLHEACLDGVELLYHDAIRSIAQDRDGVDVAFDVAPARRFDVVVGADGLHSGVRRLVFGPEERFVRHAGLYVSTLPLARAFDGVDHDIAMFNAPGRSATIHPARNKPLAAFIFWHEAVAGLGHRDVEDQRRIVWETYRGDGWHVPALLEEMRAADDLYFDSVSRVTVPSWSCGRVVLVGDAASCVSLLGDGSTLAIIGAHSLASALAAADYGRAFRMYEARHRSMVEAKQRLMPLAARLLVPRTRAGIRVRNVALRAYASGGAALRAAKRRGDARAPRGSETA